MDQQQRQNAPPERGPIDELSAWFQSIPPITRALFCGSLGLSVISRFQILDIRSLALFGPQLWKGEIWRVVTAFLVYPMSWNYFMTLYFLYKYSWSLEESMFRQRKADYVFMILVCVAATLPIALIFNVPLLLESLVMSLLYIWAMDASDQIVQFFFGIQFKDILTGAPTFMDKCIGVAVGHLFHFLDKMYPAQNNGQRIISTPAFLHSLFSEDGVAGAAGGAGRGQRLGGGGGGGGAGSYRPVPTAAETPQQGGEGVWFWGWGRGNRLGTE
ncbi:Derlin 1 [Dinochytrium kinnereticum]|nr:Derlin 1 [Dinochytrium kinnereticum]